MTYLSNVFSVLRMKCPRCHEGDLFVNKNTYRYKGFFDMPDRCPKCHQDFQIEAGFYYGAMYASYALTIIINVLVFLVLSAFLTYDIGLFLSIDLAILIVTMPYIFKISRAIWIAIIVKYDSKAISKNDQKT
jgi:uncharacterized protein (DUF983 family)